VLNVETTILDDTDTRFRSYRRRDRPPQPALMLGYLDDPAKTAEAFAGGWFHSGTSAATTSTVCCTSWTAKRT